MTHISSDGSNQAPLVASGTPVPGTDAQTYTTSDGSMQEALPVQGGGGEGGPVEWADVLNKPATFPPTVGTTATTAKAGDYEPAWNDVTSKPAVMGVGATQQEALTAIGAIPTSQKGQANGVAPLDSAGLVPLEHLNVSGLTFKGPWDPTTNTPALLDGTGNTGDFYKASADGTFNFGNGDHIFVEGDWVMFAAGVWQRLGSKETVASVNGKIGTVSLTAADVGARPSSYVPSWTEITGKPTVRGTIGPAIPAIYAWSPTDQSLASNATTVVNWTNSSYDPFSMLSNGEFVIPSWATHARATISLQFSGNATGYRYVSLRRNGAVWFSARQLSIGTDPSTVQLTTAIRPVAEGSVFSVGTWQNSGATLTVNPQSWVQIELYAAQ